MTGRPSPSTWPCPVRPSRRHHRRPAPPSRRRPPGILVGGSPALRLDYRQAALADTWRIVPLVSLAITLILGLLLRSIVAPVMLPAAVVLPFAASLGIAALVFTHVLGFGVITAAGLVLAGTFAALAQIPDVTVAEVGIAVAIGVLVDTLLVRSLQVPALVTLLAERTWWPARAAGTGRAEHHR
ncbi:MMPL family transporter [Actinomadura violacea]|uniref:MMPL family transporter n=1 Tax=Actinomadura violacea TaxID=2819934 RepID=A0ABS3S7D2_9ACTN|nr:MMPL family transporter [Actinomadura violacea]MBO2464125.1 MMPL family transporter [Actinomadura violacea]